MCVSGQYHQYCSAHDEWLIMTLCMYVRYHTANNVSNFVGDPVIQLNLMNLIVCVCVSGDMSPYCSVHDELLIVKLCMYVRYHTANNVSNCGGDPVTQLHFITIFKRFHRRRASGVRVKRDAGHKQSPSLWANSHVTNIRKLQLGYCRRKLFV